MIAWLFWPSLVILLVLGIPWLVDFTCGHAGEYDRDYEINEGNTA